MSSSMLLPGRPPLVRSRPSLSTSTATSMTTTTQRIALAKTPPALPLAGLAAAAAAAWLAARVLPGGDDDDNGEVRREKEKREREGGRRRERASAMRPRTVKRARVASVEGSTRCVAANPLPALLSSSLSASGLGNVDPWSLLWRRRVGERRRARESLKRIPKKCPHSPSQAPQLLALSSLPPLFFPLFSTSSLTHSRPFLFFFLQTNHPSTTVLLPLLPDLRRVRHRDLHLHPLERLELRRFRLRQLRRLAALGVPPLRRRRARRANGEEGPRREEPRPLRQAMN